MTRPAETPLGARTTRGPKTVQAAATIHEKGTTHENATIQCTETLRAILPSDEGHDVERVLAIVHDPATKRTGAAGVDTHGICVWEDTPEAAPFFAHTESVVAAARPQRLIVPGRGCSTAYLDALHKTCAANGCPPPTLAMQRDFECPRRMLSEGALNALRGVVGWHVPIYSSVRSAHMAVDRETLAALDIVDDSAHPNAHASARRGGICIESMLATHCRTAAGKAVVRHWLSHPLCEAHAINARLDAVERIIKSGALERYAHALRRVPASPTHCVAVCAGEPSHRSLKGLCNLIEAALLLADIEATSNNQTHNQRPDQLEIKNQRTALSQSSNERTDILEAHSEMRHETDEMMENGQTTRKMVHSGIEDGDSGEQRDCGMESKTLKNILERITGTVDLGQESSEGLCVREGVSGELDALRRQYAGLSSILSMRVREVADSLRAPAETTVNIVYFPQLGFLAAIRCGESEDSDDDVPSISPADCGREVIAGNEHLVLMFATANVLYCKEDVCRGLDSTLGDVYAAASDAETAVVHALAREIAAHSEALHAAARAVAEADALCGLAAFASAHGLVRPEIADAPVLVVDDGRHLVLEHAVGRVVANDSLFTMPHDVTPCGQTDDARVHVITGPNGAGKSAYMRMVGALVVMAQAGSFVPARRAVVGPADRVCTRMRTRECAASTHSAFQTDVAQVHRMLTLCTERSVLLVDEFGKGTQPCDGAALLAGAIAELAERPLAPRSVFATHFHEIYSVISDAAVRWLAMDAVHHPGDGASVGAAFLFRVVPGRPAGSSGAVACARRAGVPLEVCERAAELVPLFAAGVAPAAMRYVDIDDAAYALCERTAEALVARDPLLGDIAAALLKM